MRSIKVLIKKKIRKYVNYLKTVVKNMTTFLTKHSYIGIPNPKNNVLKTLIMDIESLTCSVFGYNQRHN